jgi:hypothetical protein
MNPQFIANRKTQFEDTFGTVFKNEKNCIILGDYNMDSA